MKRGPEARVRAQLLLARKIAWDSFESPCEETVMAVFSRLCYEHDCEPLEEMPGMTEGATLH